VTVFGYCRVSTDEQASTGHGLAAQRQAIQVEADRRGWQVTWAEDAGWSGASLDRPGIADLLPRLRRDDVLVVARLDRLSRSLADFAGLMQLATRKRWSLVALDLGVDTTTPTGRLVANVMASVAEWEREIIAERTRAGMAAAKGKGRLPGRRCSLDPATRQRIVADRAAGLTLREIADRLSFDGVHTSSGSLRWYPSSVAGALKSAQLEAEAESARQASTCAAT
jgi:DNA invertase Pin-like site-specific DNA recombinase